MKGNQSQGTYDPTSGDVAPEVKRLRVLIYNFFRLEDGTITNEVDLRKFGIDSGQLVNNATVQEMCSLNSSIHTLNLSGCNLVSDVGLWAIAKHCIHMKSLNCFNCDKITTVGIRSLSLRCTELLELDLSHCNMVDDVTMTVIAGGAWHIKKLSLRQCAKVTDNGVARIASGLAAWLEYLDLTGCPTIGEFGDRGLKEIGYNCHVLKELYITAAKRVEDLGIITLAQGCHLLEKLALSGCESVSKKALRSIADNCHGLQSLKIVQNRKINDMDFQVFFDSPLRFTLKTVEIQRFENLTDKGVAVICKALGTTLLRFFLLECHHITDYSAIIIGNFCPEMRELDFRYCGQLTDDCVQSLARKLSRLTSLKLDGNNKITSKGLLRFLGREFQFLEMATQWLGYKPRADVEDLIAQAESNRLRNEKAITIQCMIRKKFADRIYWERYRVKLLAKAVLLFQARVRGVIQRKRYHLIQAQLRRVRAAILIQVCYRRHFAMDLRAIMIKKKRYREYTIRLAALIQRMYRGYKARIRVAKVRNVQANDRTVYARRRAMEEMRAGVIQRNFRAYKARVRVVQMYYIREEKRRRQILLEKCMREIQRIAHGKIGRIRMRQRREEVRIAQLRWRCARIVQRVFRGHRGRIRFKKIKHEAWIKKLNLAATNIQRIYRGYRGWLLGQVARALRILRAHHQKMAVEMQRFVRGCIGRHRFKIYKDVVTLQRRKVAGSILIQRIYRGHRAREVAEIEAALQRLESQAKPLFDHLRKVEHEAGKLRKVIHRLEGLEKMSAENLLAIEQELDHCMRTTNKYTDCARINETPQRFLTKFLRVRLKDHLDHEVEVHKVKWTELQAKRAILRDMEIDIAFTQRELIPLTTGLIVDIKKGRSIRLRARVMKRRGAAVRIQALWRRALVRSALYDPNMMGWVKRYDKSQSDKPYYFNTESKETVWKKPLAYNYFGDRTISAMDSLQLQQQAAH